MRRYVAVMFLVALVALEVGAATGCASASGQVRLGRESQSASQLVFDEQLIRLKGEAGAAAALTATGVSAQEVGRRILAAVVAMSSGAAQQ